MKSANASLPVVFRRRSLSLLWGLLFIPALMGCGEAKVPVVPVSGKLTLGKDVPVGAEIVLHPQGHTLPAGVAPIGRVGEDGTFQVSIYGAGEGVPAGNYVATVQWFKVSKSADGEVIASNVIPKPYLNPKTSPIKVTVKNEPTQLEPIVIR